MSERYQTGSATDKGHILDEFVDLTGYHCKHAIRILNGNAPKLAGRRGRRCLYDQAVSLSPCLRRYPGSGPGDSRVTARS